MGIEVELSKKIIAEREIIWSLLEDPKQWPTWWQDCVAARTMDQLSLREGSQLEVVLRPKRMKLRLNPVVDLHTPNKTLSLTHHSATIHSTCSWHFNDRPDGTLVTAQMVFNGFLPFVITIAQQSSIVRFSLNNNLRGLKKAAERRGLE